MSVAVFDINETTLDLSPVRVVLDRHLAGRGGFALWFARLLQLSMATTATGSFVDFSTLARSSYDALIDADGDADGGWREVSDALRSLEAHPDVGPALERLGDAGWTIVALTNSTQATVEAQLDQAGIIEHFDQVLSVEAARTYKPAPRAYQLAIDAAAVDPSELVMVACHDWDLAGAAAVGMHTAFVQRPGMTYASAYQPPALVAVDFGDLVGQLLAG